MGKKKVIATILVSISMATTLLTGCTVVLGLVIVKSR